MDSQDVGMMNKQTNKRVADWVVGGSYLSDESTLGEDLFHLHGGRGREQASASPRSEGEEDGWNTHTMPTQDVESTLWKNMKATGLPNVPLWLPKCGTACLTASLASSHCGGETAHS